MSQENREEEARIASDGKRLLIGFAWIAGFLTLVTVLWKVLR